MKKINEEVYQAYRYLVYNLLRMGFVVQAYKAYTTSSIYIKLDYGVCNSIRIADHSGKKYLKYRFNVMADETRIHTKIDGGFERIYFPITELNTLLDTIAKHRADRQARYGISGYAKIMETARQRHLTDKDGFWVHSYFLELTPDGTSYKHKD